MSVRVRPLEARDKPVWLALFKGYIEFYKATVPEDVIETLWQRLMRGGGGVPHRPRRRRRRRHARRPGARAVPPLDLVATAGTAIWRTCSSIRRGAAEGHRPGADRGRLRRSRRAAGARAPTG